MAATKTTATRPKPTTPSDNVWTDEEKAAMQESARERRSRARLSPEEERAAGEQEIQAKIAEMPEPDRTMAQRIHALVTKAAPSLVPRTYYGMPAYARDGKVLCFFQPASKFKARYSTLGFNDDAKLDDGHMWATSWALTSLTDAEETRIVELVKKAVG
jgi:uncharacterized protein YdhG (YjbR/CyaY superfamily)